MMVQIVAVVMLVIIIIIIFYFHLENQTRYSAVTSRVIEMVGWQKSKCSSSWPPITTFTCIVNIQTFKRSRRADVCCDWSVQSVTIETCCLRCAHTVAVFFQSRFCHHCVTIVDFVIRYWTILSCIWRTPNDYCFVWSCLSSGKMSVMYELWFTS